MKRILAASSPGEVAISVADGQLLVDYALWRPGAPDRVGDVYRGRVVARAPGMGGVFVSLGEQDGFLPDTRGGTGLAEGDAVLVRVSRAAQGGKGPRLEVVGPLAELESRPERGVASRCAMVLAEARSGPPGLVLPGPNPVERLAQLHDGAPVLTDDPGLAAALIPLLPGRVLVQRDLLDDELAEQIEALSRPVVSLPGGAVCSIYPTPALVAIDVDAGPAVAERRDKSAAHIALNQRIIPAIAAQIRLRNLSGAILVDLAGLSSRGRLAHGDAFREALRDDHLRPRFLGFTGLGLAEIVRPRVHPPVHELLAGPHAAGLAALRRVLVEGGRVLRASPAIAAVLEADPVALPDLARRTGRTLMLQSDPSLGPTSWVIE
ncbi:MAG: ribonuclease E/G [Acetobacteraceae bacterium]|nr:ribonuclease E/G [Acetobacteraceae bacterium]